MAEIYVEYAGPAPPGTIVRSGKMIRRHDGLPFEFLVRCQAASLSRLNNGF